MTDNRTVEGLRALAERATPGPWEAWLREEEGPILARRQTTVIGKDGVGHGGEAHGYWAATGMNERDREDAAYIAAASPDVILRLLDVVDAARAVLDRAIEFFDEDDLEPESSFAMHVVMRARDAYALRAALDRLDETGKPG